ncbi:hypothetical protein COV24_03075 [candidate division WWE3 bacterium CG10_big_fil_rev_8_21_14_0_10_32_10]|uniref:Uncharacterized protein n=1 Tax=candidate division WWE3 bacterium CG10_big_fil_rev_8_21_14_0_10_32_10 TaxID=1975090 RepID=A0A2H0RA42_UNCKA|nr:MAG: hypothetical protein COV24_03075 [candidate division WWE3 bacterium CG10_big_fil_rev_8_21_14_0_10_32_10]
MSETYKPTIVYFDDALTQYHNPTETGYSESFEERTLNYLQKELGERHAIMGIDNAIEALQWLYTTDPTTVDLIICDHNLWWTIPGDSQSYRYGNEWMQWVFWRQKGYINTPVIIYTDDPLNAKVQWTYGSRISLDKGDIRLFNTIVAKVPGSEITLLEEIKKQIQIP